MEGLEPRQGTPRLPPGAPPAEASAGRALTSEGEQEVPTEDAQHGAFRAQRGPDRSPTRRTSPLQLQGRLPTPGRELRGL